MKNGKQTFRRLFYIYLLLLHIILVLLFLKSDFMESYVGKRFKQELTPYYHALVAFQSRVDANLNAGYTLFIGDSQIQGLCVTCVEEKSVNYGIASDTTVGILNRLPEYKSLGNARAVVLQVGVNDLSRRDDNDIVSNYQAILNRLPSDSIVVLAAIFPIDSVLAENPSRSNGRIKSLNIKLKKLCSNDLRCRYIDSGGRLQDNSGNLRADYHLGDGVHLNPAGYRVWINELKLQLD